MPRFPAVALAALVAAPALAGCALWGGDDNGPLPPTPPTPGVTPTAVEVTFAGTVRDALDERPVRDARVRVDLASERPCRQQGIIWSSWEEAVDADGRFGPRVLPAPNSPSYRFFVHVTAPGYSEEVVYVGPAQSATARDLDVTLHPRVAVNGSAPPGTVLALASGDAFPRFAVANESGAFRFDDARTLDAQLVAATADPHRARVTPPADVDVPEANATGWALQGVVKRDDGRPVATRVVAWNGTELWSAAVTDEVGRFLLPLPREPVTLRIEARSADDQWGGALVREVNGPPSVVETVVARTLC